jgi:hypothetical protein
MKLEFMITKICKAVPSHDRLVPLVSLQKKVYMSILRKELPKLVALSSGTSNHQSLQNTVSEALAFLIYVLANSLVPVLMQMLD